MTYSTTQIDRKSLTQAITRFLIKKAQQRQTTTYQEIALEFGLPSTGNAMGRALSPLLGDIYRWSNNLQEHGVFLTALVVRKSGQDKGAPGQGFWQLLVADEPESLYEVMRMHHSRDHKDPLPLYRVDTIQRSLLGAKDDVLGMKTLTIWKRQVAETLHLCIFDFFDIDVEGGVL